MDDERLDALLERLVPAPVARKGWDDVLARAGSIARRRRPLLAFAAALACSVAVAASLAAAAQLAGLLGRTDAPHLLLHGDLRGADGAPIGTIEIELPRAAVAFGPPVTLLGPSRVPEGVPRGLFPARWFLDTDGLGGRLVRASLYLRRAGGQRGTTVAILCSPCRRQESGRMLLSRSRASALVNDQIGFLGGTSGRLQAAHGRLMLVRGRLRRGLSCRLRRGNPVDCETIYTG